MIRQMSLISDIITTFDSEPDTNTSFWDFKSKSTYTRVPKVHFIADLKQNLDYPMLVEGDVKATKTGCTDMAALRNLDTKW